MGNSGSVSGGSNDSFVYTSGTGSMIAQVGNTDVLFPVGYTDYNPVTLNNSSTAANFDVSVSNTIIIQQRRAKWLTNSGTYPAQEIV